MDTPGFNKGVPVARRHALWSYLLGSLGLSVALECLCSAFTVQRTQVIMRLFAGINVIF